MQRWIAVLIGLLLLGGCAEGPPAEVPPTAQEDAEPVNAEPPVGLDSDQAQDRPSPGRRMQAMRGDRDAAPAGVRRERKAQRSLEQQTAKLWWKRPRLLAGIELTAEQQASLDAAAQQVLAELTRLQDEAAAARADQRAALEAMDLAALQGSLNRQADLQHRQQRVTTDLLFASLSQLTPAQQDQLLGDPASARRLLRSAEELTRSRGR